MSRARKVALLALAVVVLLAAVLWALPEVVRRVAVDRLSKATGRAAAIDDVDLNLFTGHLAIKGFRLAERGGGGAPFAGFERLDLRLGVLDLLRSHVRVREIALLAPTVRVERQASGELNVSDLLGSGTKRPEEPSPGPSRWTVSIERARIARGRVEVVDRGVSPQADWLVQELELDARGLTTRAAAAPGGLDVGARINEARLAIHADPVGLDPLRIAARVSLDGFETRRLNEYVYIPRRTPYMPRGGQFGLRLTLDVDSAANEIQKAAIAGTLILEREAMHKTGRPDPFLSASRVTVEIREADLLARRLTLAAVELEGVELAARRDAKGVIDVVDVFTPKPAPGGAPPPAAATTPAAPAAKGGRTLFPVIRGLARGFEEIRVERFALAPSTLTFVDERVKPPARLVLTKLRAQADRFTWPATAPMALTLSAGLPGGGTVDVKGPITVTPFDAELTIAIRDAPVEPYQSYIPIPARLSGRFSGDSRNRIAFRNGVLIARSRGTSWGQNVELREPGATRPAIRVERMELVGIDFDWPKRAAAARAGFRRPRLEVERSADGSINLRRLFTPPAEAGAPPPAPAPQPAPGPPSKSLVETIELEFGEVRIEDGAIRFLDRTTQPAFSQDLSRLALSVTGYGNRPGRRAKVSLQSVVGGDAALDIRGEIGPLAAPADVDLVGELRSFQLPSVDPYAAKATGWVIRKGDLQYKVRFRLDGNQLSADNDVAIGQLQVAPASGGDEVKRRIGLPLGLIVSLVKDQKGEIRVNVPVSGTLNDPKFALGDAIWTAVKNVLVNVVTAPFKALGRLFSGGGESDKLEAPKVDPVTFAAGSAVLSPEMEEHLVRVGDFLRRSPFVNLALAAVPSPADGDALRTEAVAARLREFQREHGLDDAAALPAYYQARLPDVPLPPTVDEQLALLREREPAPDALLSELSRRRIEATRERLVTVEGIPPPRVSATPPEPAPPSPPARPSGADGRVEFTVVPGE